MPQDLILFVAANPSNAVQSALDAECAAIEVELRAAPHRDFVVQSRWAVTVDELMRHLNALQPTVLHFSGHGTSDAHALGDSTTARDIDQTDRHGNSGIYLEDDRRGPQLVTGGALSRMVGSAASSVRLVVLNACHSKAQADALCQVVDCVVGMEGAIEDHSARSFAVGFYRALGNRCSVATAVEQGVATLAGKRLPGEHAPRWFTRDGIDARRLFLTGPAVRDQPWAQRLDAVVRLSREAHDKLISDPFGAAARARQAIDHVVDYLYERELGTVDDQVTLEAKFRRVDAKQVIPRGVANHLSSTLIHASSMMDASGMAAPEPGLLQPALGSLDIVVAWFFRDYLKQPAPGRGDQPEVERAAVPDTTPVNSTTGTMLSNGTRFGTGIGEIMPIWRTEPTAPSLRIEAAEPDGPDEHVFKVQVPDRTYLIGRKEQRRDGQRNDFALPDTWDSISRDQATVVLRGSDVVLTNTSNRNNVFVCGELVAQGSSRSLRHGDTVQFGRCLGTFADGRYYAAAPATAIDRRTGLLSRVGVIVEIAGALATGAHRLLLVIRCPEDMASTPSGVAAADPERTAVAVAVALHRRAPVHPIARIGLDVALLAPEEAVPALVAEAQRIAGVRCASGFATLQGKADQALPCLEACLGALSRIAIAGRDLVGPEDLTRYALVPTPLDAFAGRARPLFERGGGAVLFVLGDLERLGRMAPHAVAVLELELFEMLGARMAEHDIVSFAGQGQLLFGTQGGIERVAHEITVTWHARGPVTANAFEIDRCLSAHLLTISDLDALEDRIEAFARGEIAALGASGLPAPLAVGALAVDEARDPLARARALVDVAELSWKLLAFILTASTRGMSKQAAPCDAQVAASPWPAPWRSLARAAALQLDAQPTRVAELAAIAVAADCGGLFREAMDVVARAAELVAPRDTDPAAVAPSLPLLERAVRELFTALAPLRGWTLVGVVSAEVIDVEGTAQRIEYVDYTGPSVHGSLQRVTAMGLRGLGRFVYLVRWDETLAIALEPYARCVGTDSPAGNELFLATSPIVAPGMHRYRSVGGAREIEQLVTARQLGMASGQRTDGDDPPAR